MSDNFSKSPHLDKVAERFVAQIEAEDGKPIYELTPEEARDFLTELQRKSYYEIEADIDDTVIQTDCAGEVPVRIVRPKEWAGVLPVIIYCHGGGWVMGDKLVYDMTLRTLADCVHAAIVFVDYSRAPEAKYPVALNQVYCTIKYFVENGENYGMNPSKIAVIGDSAGGNLATAALIRANKSQEFKVCFQGLIYPVTDANLDFESYNEFKKGPWLSKKAMEYFWDAYLPNESVKDDIYVSPINATARDLEGLPPTLVITDENDVLRDEGEAYARKLIEAGVETVCVRINNTFHDFIMLNALRESLAVKSAYKLLCRFLKHKLYD